MNVGIDQKRGKPRTTGAGSSGELPSGGWLDHRTMAFALRTGLRAGEQVNLAFVDLGVDGAAPKLIVRVGSQGEPVTRKSTRGQRT